MDNPAYIFLHIHKTAGTTLRTIVVQRFEEPNVYETYDKQLTEPDDKALSAKVFYGHNCWYGIHEIIKRDCQYITFLRDPYERLVSLWYHHWLMYLRAKNVELKFDDFFGFLESTSMINTITQHPTTRTNTLENAKWILSQYSFIGLMETFDKDVKQLFPNAKIVTINVNSEKAKHFDLTLPPITEEQSDRIQKATRQDQELYDHVVQLRNSGFNDNFRLIPSASR